MQLALLKDFAADCWPALSLLLGWLLVGLLRLDPEAAYVAGALAVLFNWSVDRRR